MGMAVRHVLSTFANNDPNRVASVKVRFTKHVFPGETIATDMWKVSTNLIEFQVRVVDRQNAVVIAQAFVELKDALAAAATTTAKSTSKSSQSKLIFDRFNQVYTNLPALVKKDQVKKVDAIFQFNIEDADQVFHIDLKHQDGSIGSGECSHSKPDITIMVNDKDFSELAAGRLSGQEAFMKGKVKVQGNMMLAMKLDRLLKTLSTPINSKH